MFSKIVLCVNSRQATVGLWRMGRLRFCTIYPNTPVGHDDFRQFLSRHPNIPVHLITDAVEEDFRLETMPHSSGSARQEMLDRKLGQLYRNSSYRTALFAGRESDKRRDDRFLLMALTNPDIVTPWVGITEELQAPLAGVYLLPMISELLVKTLKLKNADLLLMTRSGAGLRQTYFSGQHLRVSRMTPLTGMGERQINELYASETEKTRLYLVSLRMIARENRLHLVFASTEQVPDTFNQQIEGSQGISSDVIGLEQLSVRLGIETGQLKRYPDLLHMHVLARQSLGFNLAPARQTRHHQVYKLRIGINMASATCVTLAAILSGMNLADTSNLGQQLKDAVEQTRQQEKRYDEVASNFPKTPIAGKDLKDAVELAKKIDGISRTPQRLLLVLSSAMDEQREIQINRLHWVLDGNANMQDADVKPNGTQFVPPLPPSPTGLYEIGFITGEISNFNGDYRDALASVNTLAEHLKNNSQVVQVVILQQPVNTSSLAKLQGSTLDEQNQQLPAAEFKLKVVLKPENPA